MLQKKPTRSARRIVAERFRRFFESLVARLSPGAEDIWKRAETRAESPRLHRHEGDPPR